VLVAADWRWAFLINVPVGLLVLPIDTRLLPDPPGERAVLPDALGVLLLMAAVGALTLGLVQGNEWG
jgi:hypothetical protein